MNALKFPPYTVGTADFGVRTATSVRYPDVLVDGAVGLGTDLAATAPAFVGEILSPSTMAIDFRDKTDEYQTIPTLHHYLILAQDQPLGWLWSRQGNGWVGPQLHEDPNSRIVLEALNVTIDFSVLYDALFDRDRH
jgi:Uma2 family endonuclease